MAKVTNADKDYANSNDLMGIESYILDYANRYYANSVTEIEPVPITHGYRVNLGTCVVVFWAPMI